MFKMNIADPFNACQTLHYVELHANFAQQTMYDDHETLELNLWEQSIRLFCCVPKSVLDGSSVAHDTLSCHFHGGGLITGKPVFGPWNNPSLATVRKPNMIHIEPFYPLMPESNGIEIGQYAKNLANILPELRTALINKFPGIDVPCYESVLCSATSAGAFLAMRYTLAAKSAGFRITGLVLLYPMLQDYERSLGDMYGGYCLTEEQHEEIVLDTLRSMSKHTPKPEIVFGRTPPDHMGIYPSTAAGCWVSFNGRPYQWRSFWTMMCGTYSAAGLLEAMHPSEHGQDEQAQDNQIELEDLERITMKASKVAKVLGDTGMQYLRLEYLEEEGFFCQDTTEGLPETPTEWPPTYIAHGEEDRNCPLEGVRSCIQSLLRLIPGAKIWLYKFRGQPHAFDYERPAILNEFVTFVSSHQQDETTEIRPTGNVEYSPAARLAGEE